MIDSYNSEYIKGFVGECLNNNLDEEATMTLVKQAQLADALQNSPEYEQGFSHGAALAKSGNAMPPLDLATAIRLLDARKVGGTPITASSTSTAFADLLSNREPLRKATSLVEALSKIQNRISK
jgi:hypothetical protein